MPRHPQKAKRQTAPRAKQNAPRTRPSTGRHKGNRKAVGRVKATKGRRGA